MRCLVTGGAGFIGSSLVRALLAQRHQVRVFDDLSSGKAENLAGLAVELRRGDIRDGAAVTEAVAGCDWVFHLAAMVSVERSVAEPHRLHAINETGTLTLLEACRQASVRRVVFASSSAVYGRTRGAAKREDARTIPCTPYAISKLSGEHYCRFYWEAHGLESVCLRFFNVFGPRQDPASPYAAVVPRFIRAALQGQAPTVYGDGAQTRDFTFVGDVVAAVVHAAAAPRAAGQVINVASGESRSLLELLAALTRITGARIAPIFAAARTGDLRHSAAAIGRAQRLLGFAPRVSFLHGLRETVAWYRDQHAGTVPVEVADRGPSRSRGEGRLAG